MSERSADEFEGQPEYEELIDSVPRLRQGSDVEDGLSGLRGRLHFYNPITHLGLSYLGLGFDSALETAGPIWKTSIQSYQEQGGSAGKIYAYTQLGKVLHLTTQDMAQPGHIHNDPHLPHALGLGGDDTPLEIRAEDWARLNNGSQFPQSTGIQGLSFTRPSQFGHEVALQTYQLSQFPGNLNLQTQSGSIQLPSLTLNATFYFANMSSPDPRLRRDHWRLLVGPILFYFPDILGDGQTLGENQIQDWWRIQENLSHFYIDRQDSVSVNGQTLSAYLIQQCAPIGMNYGAGLLKLFHDIVKEPAYVRDIEIIDSTNQAMVYETHVTPSSSLTRNRSPHAPPNLKFDRTYEVRITYSQPMTNPSFSIGSFNTNLSGGNTNNDGSQTWTGSLTIPNSPGQCNQPMNLTFGGVDTFNHLLPGGGGIAAGIPLDLNPETVARRDPNTIDSGVYDWLGYEPTWTSETFPFPCDCASGPDTTPPTITLDPTALNACVSQPGPFNLIGKVRDNCSDPSLTFQGNAVTGLQPTGVEHEFSFNIPTNLNAGTNPIALEAVDQSTPTANHAPLNFDIRVGPPGPQLTGTSPADGATNIPQSSVISASFNEALQGGQIHVFGAPLSGTSQISGNSIQYVHSGLQQDKTYTAIVTGLGNSCGNSLNDPRWVFSTSNIQNQMNPPPGIDPGNGAASWSNADTVCVGGSIEVPVTGGPTIHS